MVKSKATCLSSRLGENMGKTEFVVSVDENVAVPARAAAMLHGLDIEVIVSRLVTSILRDYAGKVRGTVPKPDFGDKTELVTNPELTEDDIPF